VYRQFALWPEAQAPDQETKIWQQLDPETKRIILSALSRLISKAVRPESLRETKETNHERQ